MESEEPPSPAAEPLTRRGRVLRWAIVGSVLAATVIVVLVVSSSFPPGSINETNVAHESGALVSPGVSGAVYFPFQATPSAGTSGQTNSGIVNASVSGDLHLVACSSTGACAGVLVEIVTAGELHAYTSHGTLTPLWCYSASTGPSSSTGCSALSQGHFTAPLLRDAGIPLDLLLVAPSGATASATVAITATLYWTA